MKSKKIEAEYAAIYQKFIEIHPYKALFYEEQKPIYNPFTQKIEGFATPEAMKELKILIKK